jgi:DNA modification methylase
MNGATHRFIVGDVIPALKTLPDESVQCCVTSPPYWALRNYTKGHENEIGMENSPQEYVKKMVEVFHEVNRVLRSDGVLFLNLGDKYATGKGSMFNPGGGKNSLETKSGKKEDEIYPLKRENISDLKNWGLKPKDLIGIPWRVAFALQEDGWYLRNDNIWCLSGNMRVYVRSQKGEMPITIKDMARLDPTTLELYNGEKWVKVKKIQNIGENSEGLRILLRSGERITSTHNHTWITERGFVKTSDLIVGDILKTCKLPEPTHPIKPGMLPDDDIGWFVGMYLAEGSFGEYGKVIQIASHAKEIGRYERLSAIAKKFGGTCNLHRINKTSGNAVTMNIRSPVLRGVLEMYIVGNTAKHKHLSSKCWGRSNNFLHSLLNGYLEGDGHHDIENSRWRLGFTNNSDLEKDLRTLCARLGIKLTLKSAWSRFNEKYYPMIRGEIRFTESKHHNIKKMGEIVSISPAEKSIFYNIEVEHPHIFALSSGVLTHNSKLNCTPFPAMDRFVNSHEYVFLFAKSQKYYFDWYGVSEPVKITTLQRATRGRGSPTNKYLTADDYGQGKQGIHSNITPHSKEKVPARFGISNPKFGGKKYPEEVGGVYSGNGYDLTSRKRKRDVWLFATASTSEKHYAVFPETIPEIAILGGTSEHGGCSTCGAPYNRLIEKTFDKLEPVDPIERQGVKLTPEDSAKVLWIDEFGGEYRLSVKGDKHHKMWADQPVKGGRANHYETKGYTILYYNVPFAEDATIEEWKKACGADSEGGYKGVAKKEYEDHGCQNPSDIKRRILEGMKQVVTSGWEKTCKCEGEGIIQCTVLDPFVGSGTTSAVAKRLNRSSIGIDLDPKNVPIQKKRMGYTEDQNRLVEDCEWVVL